MNATTLLPLILIIGVMFFMTRSAKRRQQQAQQTRNTMEPGSGVRTIGGMYALVKSVNDDTVELEVAPGVHAHYAKNAVAAVLDPQEYASIVHGTPRSEDDFPAFEADTEQADVEDADVADAPVELRKDAPKSLDLGKAAPADGEHAAEEHSEDAGDEGPAAK